MPKLQDISDQINNLDPVELEKLLLAILSSKPFSSISTIEWYREYRADDYPSIVTSPMVCGGAARVIRTRIPVWTIERMRQLGISDSDILRNYPTLRAEDLVQARSYATHHREEIEQAIRENEEE